MNLNHQIIKINMQTIKPSVLTILILTCFSMVTVQPISAEQVNRDLHDGLQMVSDMVQQKSMGNESRL